MRLLVLCSTREELTFKIPQRADYNREDEIARPAWPSLVLFFKNCTRTSRCPELDTLHDLTTQRVSHGLVTLL